jgi:hypothetical protein
MTEPRQLNSYSQGYALCNAAGTLLGYTYRATAAEAIEASFPSSDPASDARWAEHQALGWTVEHVFARIFTPVFFKSAEGIEGADVEVDT